MAQDYAITRNEAEGRFETTVDGVLCVLEYGLRDGVMTITHTGVPEVVGGRGVAAALTRCALDTARAEGWRSRAAFKLIRRNEDFLREPCVRAVCVDQAAPDQDFRIRKERAFPGSIGVDCLRKGAQSNRPFIVALCHKAVLCAGSDSKNVLFLSGNEFFARALIRLCAERERRFAKAHAAW